MPRSWLDARTLVAVAAGGGLGSLVRWALGRALPLRDNGFPVGTLLANVSGSFLLAALTVLIAARWPTRPYLRPFFGVGLLGGYTTFSTYLLDTHALVVRGDLGLAVVYAAGSVVLGVLAAWAGMELPRGLLATDMDGRQ